MEISDENQQRQGANNNESLNLDRVFATQPELGPSIPDGGYGWVVFFATLFFQALVPSIVVNFGIFMIYVRLENGSAESNTDPSLWEEDLFYVPLFYIIAKTIFDPLGRFLISMSTWPRLVSTSGTCLISAGLLFMWMGIAEDDDSGVSVTLYVLGGLLSGIGSALVLAQCEILLSQYFRLKLPALNQIIKAVVVLGFMVSPVILGEFILRRSLKQIVLWYLAVIMQGVIFGLVFQKPAYLKSKPRNYRFIFNSNADDEENIFSKNDRELQITRQSSTTDESRTTNIQLDPLPSTSAVTRNGQENKSSKSGDNWEKFDNGEVDVEVYNNYEKLDQDWETFDDEDLATRPKKQDWERFDDGDDDNTNNKNTLSLAEEINPPLYSHLRVNNNNSYAYDDEITVESPNSMVFTPNIYNQTNSSPNIFGNFAVLKEPTFYKSLLMVITNNYSSFVFYTLFPSYLYLECDNVDLHTLSLIIGALSIVPLIFSAISFWINIDKDRRAYCFWALCWLGCVGYFIIADYKTERALLAGSVLVILSVTSLDHIGMGLIGATIRGERSREHGPLALLGGSALFLFLLIDMSFKTCFRLMAVLHFFVGALWLGNFIYKKIRV